MRTEPVENTHKTPHNASLLASLAQTYGTPTYVYDESIIRRQCKLLKQHLKHVPTKLLYAMKANSHPAILRIIKSEGIGIDAVSPAELYLAQQIGFAPKDILYTANNMTDEEMHTVAEAGVLMNLGELSRVARYGAAYPGAEVCVRLNPQIGSGHHAHVVTAGKATKFGIPVNEVEQILEAAARNNLKIVGLHQHIGSGIPSMAVLQQAIEVILQTAQYFPDLRILNLGGGFSIPYRPEDVPIDFENFQQTIVQVLQAHEANHNQKGLTYWFEPGRFLVAEAGTLLVTANTVKEANNKTFAGTDSGMNQLVRPSVYGAYHEIYNLSNADGFRRPYEVVGNICESGDVFAKNRLVQEISENDTLAIMDAGAYGMSMASLYNLRPLPAEVLIKADGSHLVIQERVSEADLVNSMFGTHL
ncbi:MAG: diaminopimelate decarboxylase [Bacteroidota bacterium]